MKRLVAALALALVPASAGAWEPQTTHAGLAEQAALASRLHKRLVSLGFVGGLFEPLTIPPADAPALTSALKLLSPTHGSVPDARGRQVALAWLTAGAALADVPAVHGANHFYDPATGRGWVAPDRGMLTGLSDKIREALGRSSLPGKGVPAPDWVTDKTNPFNLEQFLNQYAKAVSAATPGERSRYMAAALVAAGAMLHTLGDLGAPSRVRGDTAAHLDTLGAGPDDLGSRFERIAALAYGRLGVPAPSRTVTRTHLREYFTAKTGDGLADETTNTFFSQGTLPGSTRTTEQARPQLARALPALPARLNLTAALREPVTLRAKDGTCLARYRVENDVVRFYMDDDCMLDQIGKILPEVASFETGMLDFLLRGELEVKIDSDVVVTGAHLGAGTVEVLVEDARGVRTPIGSAQVRGGAGELARLAAPASGVRVVAVFQGADEVGEPLVAVGAAELSR